MDNNDSNILEWVEVERFEEMEKVMTKLIFKGVILKNRDGTTIRVGSLVFDGGQIHAALPKDIE